MIGRLRGILVEKQPPQLLVDVNGVGYELQASMATFYRLPELNQALTLYTHFVVREDAQLLYGFHDTRERDLFRTLIKVNGVGPKMVLAILSGMEADAFVQCVADNDVSSLVRLPGVGKKTAERLIIEMRDRLADWQGEFVVDYQPTAVSQSPAQLHRGRVQDAISALIALGYKPQEASNAVQQVNDDQLRSEELIRLALRRLMK